MKDRLRGVLLACLILLAGAVLGILLLVAVYGIPVSKMADHYAVSLESIKGREGWHRYIAGRHDTLSCGRGVPVSVVSGDKESCV